MNKCATQVNRWNLLSHQYIHVYSQFDVWFCRQITQLQLHCLLYTVRVTKATRQKLAGPLFINTTRSSTVPVNCFQKKSSA